ncbi:MAG TPA: energy transducer TonB [Candidatus Sulfotelmatobacter sp.]|nr:energy transducer TonB [Candidatus Sulfotelmatobacter sp.]
MVAESPFPEDLFADSLLDTSWAARARRGWTTLTSFGVQVLAIGLLLLLPLWKTVGLPTSRTVSTPVILGHHSPEPAHGSQPAHASATPSTTVARFVAPGHIPTHVVTGPDDASSAPPSEISVLDRIGDGVGNGPPLAVSSGNYPVVLPPAPVPSVRQFRKSEMLEGSLIRRVQPVYPYPAKAAHVQGMVVLAATISKAGAIENLQVRSGHPLLVGAAIEAVKQWRYRPYILNGEVIEVETEIRVNFTLAEN